MGKLWGCRCLRLVIALQVFGHTFQQGADGGMYAVALHGLVGHPYQAEVDGFFAFQDIVDGGFLQAIGFAQLSLGSVSVNGMAQAAFGHAHQHFDGRFAVRGLHFAVNDAHGEDGGRAATSGEESFDFAQTTEVFGFLEGESHGGCVMGRWESDSREQRLLCVPPLPAFCT